MPPRLSCLLLALAAVGTSLRADDRFERHVRPVLVDTCFRCHGGDKVSGGLRVDSAAALRKGGESGPAVVPGDVTASLLLRVLRREDGVPAMPPDKPLPPATVDAIAAWVRDGAPWPVTAPPFRATRHWAFEPVRAAAPPATGSATAVDAFLDSRLRTPVGSADRRTLIRRVTFDLIGLPPTPEEVDDFLNDTSPLAYVRLVDRLLASPHYGERWGRHWLDLVRYADTAGENSDHPLPHAWRYRNRVLDAFNADLPYDEFLREQVAGDLLAAQGPPERHAERVAATGFLAIARRFGHDIDKDIHLTLEDAIDTLGKSVLGLTLGCARCHAHKYDPVSMEDYYALYGILASTKFAFPGCEPQQQPRDLVPLLPPAEWERAGRPVAYAVVEGKPADARLHERGDPEKPGKAVPRRWLSVLGGQPLPPGSGSGRLQLAAWLTAPDNPLTARVFVNRVWQHHFGRGLVTTPNDFGTRGQPPTHPELLDVLAAEFSRGGWQLKPLHRRILLSTAYQRATGQGEEAYGHFTRRRLGAEELRDSLLQLGGTLDRSPGGPHPFPPEKSWNFTQHNPFSATFETNRRGVYLMTLRNRRHPFLGLFDGADPNATTPKRDATTVPTQALYFMNDPFFHTQAGRLADRVGHLSEESERLTELYRLTFQRGPVPRERAWARAFLARYETDLNEIQAGERARAAWAALARVLLASNEFLYLD